MNLREIAFQSKLPEKLIHVPEWDYEDGDGKKVKYELLMVCLSAPDAMRWSGTEPHEELKGVGQSTHLITMCARYPKTKKRIFEENDYEKMARELDPAVIERLAQEALDISGLSKKMKDALEKNSPSTTQ